VGGASGPCPATPPLEPPFKSNPFTRKTLRLSGSSNRPPLHGASKANEATRLQTNILHAVPEGHDEAGFQAWEN
jgi:hypothetical protein